MLGLYKATKLKTFPCVGSVEFEVIIIILGSYACRALNSLKLL
jgi:hypothetical protein